MLRTVSFALTLLIYVAPLAQAQSGPARFFHGGLPTGQGELAEMGHTLTGGFRDQEELTAPDGAIQAVAGAIPGDAEDRRFELILGHAGEHVGDVVLDGYETSGEGRGARGKCGRARCP